jgi:hypothetical protein
MSTKDYFQRVPNATSFQVLDHVTWNNNIQMRLEYFYSLVNGSTQRVHLSFTQSIASSTTASRIISNSYSAIIANTNMWNTSSDFIYLPESGVYSILTEHSFNGIGGTRTFDIQLYNEFNVSAGSFPIFYENITAGDVKSHDIVSTITVGSVVINEIPGYSIELKAAQNSGSALTVTGDIYVQKMASIYE